jgi:DNA-binding NarL/FixJ family response regulator
MRKIKVLLVDDHVLFRSGMRRLLSVYRDIEVVGEAGSGEEALQMIDSVAPDVILMDVDMPGRGGVLSTALIRSLHPNCRILLLTGYQQYAAAGIQAGARGYILKHAEEDEIADAIRIVYQGGVYLQSEIQPAVVDVLQDGTATSLTERQLAIIRLVAEGLTTRDIGNALGISEHRVKQHISAILEQLRANDRAHAVAIAIRQGLL